MTNQDFQQPRQDRDWMNVRRLASAEVPVIRRYSIHTTPNHLYPRDCYSQAVYYVELHRIKDVLLVQGESVSGGLQQHAWVELPGGILFDGVLQRFYDKTLFYELDLARPWYKFTRKAVLWIVEQRFRVKRWDLPLGLPWADFQNPLLITDTLARKFLENKRLSDTNQDKP